MEPHDVPDLVLPGMWGESGKQRGGPTLLEPTDPPAGDDHFSAMGQELWQKKTPEPGGDPILASLDIQDAPLSVLASSSSLSLSEGMGASERTTILEADRPEFEH